MFCIKDNLLFLDDFGQCLFSQNTSNSDLRDVDGEVEKEIAAIYEAVPLDKNYSTFPLLVGPPRVGDRLVYKVSITFR